MSKNIKRNTVLKVNPIMAAVTGAVVGAGVAIAAAGIVMSDEKNQDKVKGALANVQDIKEQIKESVIKEVAKV